MASGECLHIKRFILLFQLYKCKSKVTCYDFFQTGQVLNAEEPFNCSTFLSTISIVTLFNFSHFVNDLVLLVKGQE